MQAVLNARKNEFIDGIKLHQGFYSSTVIWFQCQSVSVLETTLKESKKNLQKYELNTDHEHERPHNSTCVRNGKPKWFYFFNPTIVKISSFERVFFSNTASARAQNWTFFSFKSLTARLYEESKICFTSSLTMSHI